MKNRLIIFFKHALFWLFFFLVIKIEFLLFHFEKSLEIGFIDCLRVLISGIKLDISATAYIMILPAVFIIIFPLGTQKLYKLWFKYYTLFLIILISLLCIIDLELYTHWGFRLDSTPLTYINTPGEMTASIELFVLIRQLILGAIMFAFFSIIYNRFIKQENHDIKIKGWKISTVFLIILGSLIIPMRGGLGIAPINTGSAYFHTNMYANHAANNLIWNLGYSMANLSSTDPDWSFMPEDQAKFEFNAMMEDEAVTESYINGKPNVIILILESFTSKVIAPLGGIDNITPNINRLCKEGILFNNFYANSDRSDKGIVSILSGYPSQPNLSIIKFPQKTQSLPGLNLSFKDNDYYSMFYYGGDIDFANFRSYFINMNYDNIISKDDFDESYYNSKWGVHDHILLERFSNDLKTSPQPFFSVAFTLSSHEPFDVPMDRVIEGKNQEDLYLNSIHYTDKCIGEFVNRCKAEEWWNNTIIVLISDHGSRHPGNSGIYREAKYRIPMIWLGGALNKKNIVIDNFGSQSDFPPTILNQFGFNSEAYTYSKDLMKESDKAFAFFAFNSGFGYFTENASIVYDLINNSPVISDGEKPDEGIQTAKAYLQVLSQDFVSR